MMILPCNSRQMREIRGKLTAADNYLISAQDLALGHEDDELHDEILAVRRLLTDLIDRTK